MSGPHIMTRGFNKGQWQCKQLFSRSKCWRRMQAKTITLHCFTKWVERSCSQETTWNWCKQCKKGQKKHLSNIKETQKMCVITSLAYLYKFKYSVVLLQLLISLYLTKADSPKPERTLNIDTILLYTVVCACHDPLYQSHHVSPTVLMMCTTHSSNPSPEWIIQGIIQWLCAWEGSLLTTVSLKSCSGGALTKGRRGCCAPVGGVLLSLWFGLDIKEARVHPSAPRSTWTESVPLAHTHTGTLWRYSLHGWTDRRGSRI